MVLPENISRALDMLESAGHEAWVVGGCVRDSLMGIIPHDYDITTSALPAETEQVFAGYRLIETGLKHGTVTVLADGSPIEITTYRVDGEYRDSRRPERVTFTRNIRDDVSRRDFTMNGIAYNPKQGYFDEFGGAEENAFRQLRLNQWVKQAVRWMPMEKWDKCAFAVDEDELEGRICYGGLDLSSTTDITAFVLVFPPLDEEDKYIILPYFWIPEDNLTLRVNRDNVPYDVWERQDFLQTTEGNVVHYGFIEQFIERLGERFNIREIAFDRWGAVQMVQNLEGMGFTVVPFGQGFKDMSPPTKELMKLVLEQKIAHGGHPVLRWNMDNIYIRTDPAGNIKADKEKSTEKIDGAVATIMALDRAIRCGNDHGASVYDERGILFI